MLDLSEHEGVEGLRPVLSSPHLDGFFQRDGDLEVTGDLKLNGAIIRVNGDLRVSGSIQGNGAVYVTGKTTLLGGANRLASDAQVAIVSQGDVTIKGNGSTQSTFQGLLYTRGNLYAENISLVGTFIANRPGGSQVEFSNATMVYVPKLTEVLVERTVSGFGVNFAMASDASETPEERFQLIIDNGKFFMKDLRTGFTQELFRGPTANRQIGQFLRDQLGAEVDPETFQLNDPEPSADAVLRAMRIQMGLNKRVEMVPKMVQTTVTRFKVTLNTFIRPEDRLTILLWKDL